MNNSVLNLTLGACLIATASFTLQARTLNVELKKWRYILLRRWPRQQCAFRIDFHRQFLHTSDLR